MNEIKIGICYERDPQENTNLLHLRTFVDNEREMINKGNIDWHWLQMTNPINILDWNSFCVSYSTKTRQVKLMHNGVIELNFRRPPEVSDLDDHIPAEWFGPNLNGYVGLLDIN